VVVVGGRGGGGCSSIVAGECEKTSPHPSGEGRGTGRSWERGGVARAQAVVENQPTSLMRGEGLAAGWLRTVGSALGWRERGVGGGGVTEDERTSTVMRLMSI
jgi:hypothetical protein